MLVYHPVINGDTNLVHKILRDDGGEGGGGGCELILNFTDVQDVQS